MNKNALSCLLTRAFGFAAFAQNSPAPDKVAMRAALLGGQTAVPALAASGRGPGRVFRDCSDCPEMVVIPAGNFTMGSSAAEKSWAARICTSMICKSLHNGPDLVLICT